MDKNSEVVSLEALKQFVSAYPPSPFRPLAYYDKHLDCIRIQVKDCSFTEVRLNDFITLWYENHVTSQKTIGITIKGVKYLFVKMGLPQSGPIYVAEIIDGILKYYPGMKDVIEEVIKELKKTFKKVLALPVSEWPAPETA